ncbi:MAG: phenylalanine--tRNA ligase subunit alpha [Candidatus Sumerlaeia bacterium]|nr:phenylalanine--tRNA ligase subunit alpha [Candidatus Sumerlaeia bacterium]
MPEAFARLDAATDSAALEELRVELLGKKGFLSELNARMGKLAPEEKPLAGKHLNERKGALQGRYAERKDELERAALAAALEAEAVDVTMPGIRPRPGHLHPVTRVTDEIVAIFEGMGFFTASGPQVESEWLNFESLNIPADHPARDMQDTFWTERGMVLRTHTSPTQIRVMRTTPPPFAAVTPGRVYRCDSDATHSPMFHQIEGLLVDRDVSFCHLKGVLNEFVRALFGRDVKTRFRPSFFPFTEPSAEMDIWAPFSNNWMEVLGCGMVHPQVLRNAGLDPEEWKGFAFGLGVDRLAMIRYGITDIRLLYQNDMRFLRQF